MAIKYREIPSATESTLVLNSLQSYESGFYTCVLTNDCGTVTTTAAELTVLNSEDYAEIYVSTFQELFDVSGITGKKDIVLCPGTYTMTDDLTVPVTKTLRFLQGAIIATTGQTFTCNGTIVAGTRQQIFSGTGTVAGLNIAYPEWWGGGNNVDSTNALTYAIASGASLIQLQPGSTYLIASSITLPLAWVGKIYANGTHAVLKWTGTTGSLMRWNSSYAHLENIKLDGDGQAVKLVHVYEPSSSNLTAGKYSSLKNVILYNTASAGLWLGDYTTSTYDADIATFSLYSCYFSGCYYGLYYDSINAQSICAYNTWFARVSTGVLPLNHVAMVRGGQFIMHGGGFGGSTADGTRYAVEVTDGWVYLDGVNSEFGKSGTNGGGLLYLKTSLRNDAIVWPINTVRDCKTSTQGTTTDMYIIRVDSASHPLTVQDNWFWRVNATTASPTIYNKGLANIVSSNNLYYGNPFDRVSVSTGDIQLDNATYINLPTITNEGTTGGLTRRVKEASANITASSGITISTAVPSGCRILGVQLRVDTALATGETWDAAYGSGLGSVSIATNQAVAKNTKVNVMFDSNAESPISTNTVNIIISKNGGGSFTAQGSIKAIVYYEVFEAMSDAA